MKILLMTVGLLMFAFVCGNAQAGERGTKDEAEAMVKKAVAFIKENGTEKAYEAFTKKDPQFIDRDLYIMVYDMTGKCLAHGQKEVMVGKDLSNATDVDGKKYVMERIELAKTKPSFWQEYKFMDPLTKKVEQKEAYCETFDQTIICSGVYKTQ